MAIFKLKRVNAAKWDLGDKLPDFERIRSYAIALGRYHILRDAVIVNLIMDHGVEKAEQLVTAFCGRSFLSLNKLQDLIDGTEPFEFKKPERPNEMPGADRARRSDDFKNVGDVLKQFAPVKYPTDDHVYDGPAASDWMLAKKVSFDNYAEYFSVLPQRSADGRNLLQLKSEYR